MAGAEVRTATRLILLDRHVRVTKHHLLHLAVIGLNVDDRLLAAIAGFTRADTAGRVEGHLLPTVLGHTVKCTPNGLITR